MSEDQTQTAETAETAEAQAAEGTATKAGRGRTSALAGKALYSTKDENPRRAGSHGHRSFQIILDQPGISYEDYVEKGGRLSDAKWDIEKGNLEARDE